MSLSVPVIFKAADRARASEVNLNFQAVANKFTEGPGGIIDQDCSSNMGLKGTKISNVAGNRIPTDRIEDKAIDSTKLRDDPTTGSPNAGVGSGNHIKDGVVGGLKLTALTVGLDKLGVTINEVAYSTTVGLGTTFGNVGPSAPFPVATYQLLAVVLRDLSGVAVQVATPNTTGTNWGCGFTFQNTTGAPQPISGTIVFVFIKKVTT